MPDSQPGMGGRTCITVAAKFYAAGSTVQLDRGFYTTTAVTPLQSCLLKLWYTHL